MKIKNQIEKELNLLNWKITEVGKNEHWWDDEHWKVVYKYDSSLLFFVTFILDPQFKDPRAQGQDLYEVKASRKFPTDWNDNDTTFASIQFATRKFNIKLRKFISDITKFKREKPADNT